MGAQELFARLPGSYELYVQADRILAGRFPRSERREQKSQIAYWTRHGFAYLWPPFRKVKGRPEVYIILTFVLPYRIESGKICEIAQPRHNRFTHHVIIDTPAALDDEVLDWLGQSYDFSMR